MDFLPSLPVITGTLIFFSFLYIIIWRPKNHSHQLPPEPSGAWPLIGHLHLLGNKTPVFRTLAALADKHGPIFSIRLGISRAVVVSSSEALKECFTINDKAFAGRPPSSATEYLGYNGASFGFASYGPLWSKTRKIVVMEVLSGRRLETLKHVRISEIETCIKELYSTAKNNPAKVIAINSWMDQLNLNIIVRMIAGKRFHSGAEDAEEEGARRFRKVVKEFFYITGQFLVSDVIPFRLLKWLDLEGHIKSMKRISKDMDEIFQEWMDEHVERRLRSESIEDQDFIDFMLSAIDDNYSDDHTRETIIKATAMNIILAGSDTTSSHLTWLLSLLLNHRDVMTKAQQEIDIKVGKDRWVEDLDVKNLIYLQAIVKEALRLYPPGPLSVPHFSMEDCYIKGYFVPKNTRLFLNVWKLHRDPEIWPDPNEFKPERFLSEQGLGIDFSGQHHGFVPFGFGRRSCPGISLAMQVTHLCLARLIQGFDFVTPFNMPVDMTEGLGITLPKVNPLQVLLTPRLDDPSLYALR